MQLPIYRIVQDALTNTLKHAGPGTRVAVSLACEDARIVVEVSDTGAGHAGAPHTDPEGRRHARARRRVDGSLTAGPRPEAGWHVRLGLPRVPAP